MFVYVLLNPLDEALGIKTYRKIALQLLTIQFILTIGYHLFRSTIGEVDSKNEDPCKSDDSVVKNLIYDDVLSNVSDFCEGSGYRYFGATYPRVGGFWFVLAVWTAALPLEPCVSIKYTFASITLNIVAQAANFSILPKSSKIFLGYSCIVFLCLTMMRLALERLKVDIREKKIINLENIAMKHFHIITLIAIPLLYASLPSYQYSLAPVGEIQNYYMYQRSAAVGGVLNTGYALSILLNEITRLHVIDCLKGNRHKLEFCLGIVQFIGCILALFLTKIDIVNIEDGENKDDNVFRLWDLAIGCISLIWILMTYMAYRVKQDGMQMRFFKKRWIKRDRQIPTEIKTELWKPYGLRVVMKNELISLRNYVQEQFQDVINDCHLSYGIRKRLFRSMIQKINNKIANTTKSQILTDQAVYIFCDEMSDENLMEQLDQLHEDTIRKPLDGLKDVLKEVIQDTKHEAISDNHRCLLTKFHQRLLTKFHRWLLIELKKIEYNIIDELEDVKIKVQKCFDYLMTNAQSKDGFDAVKEHFRKLEDELNSVKDINKNLDGEKCHLKKQLDDVKKSLKKLKRDFKTEANF